MIYRNKRDYRPAKVKARANLKNWRTNNPAYCMWKAAKARALKRGLHFDLLLEEVVIPELCPYLKKPLTPYTEYSPSLDRVDNTKGYTKDNIEVVSKKANRMKNNATDEELLEFARAILKRKIPLDA